MSGNVRKTLLLVEDEAILAMSEKMQLEQFGYAVNIVNTGEKAIAAIKAMPEIDLVLMDINLGDGIDGTQAAEIILKEHDLPIVFVSSHTEREVVEKTEKITSYGYVVKNSSITVLDASIKMAFKLHLANKDVKNHLEKANRLLEEKAEIERRLRKNEHNHLEAQKIAHFGNYEIDLRANTAKWSEETFKIFDWNPEGGLAPTVEDYRNLIHPEDVAAVYSHFNETVRNNKVFDLEYRILTKKGNIKNVHSYGYPLTNESGQVEALYGVFQDITDRIKTQNELIYAKENAQRSESSLQGILDNMVDAYFQADQDGIITYANQTALRMYGYSSLDELVGKPASVLYANKENRDELLQEMHKTGSKIGWIGKALRKDGTSFWVSANAQFIRDEEGAIIGTQGVLHDIAEYKKAEEALRESEEKFRLLHEFAGIGIGYYSPDGRILSYNQLAAKNMGGAPEDFIGKTLFDLFPKAAADVYSDRIKEAIDSSAPHVYEDMVPLPAGNQYFLSTFTKVTDVQGKLLGIQIISQNITDRKNAEAELRESKQKAEILLGIAAEIIISLDSQGAITLLNDSGHRILGYEYPELIGRDRFETCLPSDEKEAFRIYFESSKKAGSNLAATNENDIITKKGERRSILWHNSVIRDKNGESIGMLSSGEDITQRKMVEKELLENEERLRSYLANAPDGIFITDEKGQYIEVNEAACKMTGYSEAELLQMHVTDLIPEQDIDKAVAHFQQVRQDGAANVDICFNTKNREIRHWNVAAVKLSESRFLGFTKDVTDRKRTEERLKEEEEKYRFALEGANLGEWDWDCKSGKVIRNARWAEMLGYTPKELEATIQQGVDLIHPDDVQTVRRLTKEHLDGITDHYHIEYRMRMKGGDYKWIRDSGKIMVRDSENNPIRVCGIHEDVDERKRARIRIESLLAEKELLLKEVHHRIKNNMNTVRSLLALQGGALAEPSAKRALHDAENRISSMSTLYNKLYLSRDYKELSINEYLTALVDEVVTNFPNGHIVTVAYEIDDFVVSGDKLQPIGIIVNELLTNTMKYAFKGREKGMIKVFSTKINGRIIISIQDDGIGMPESISFQGSNGFGLQLVEALARQLDGDLRIERGKGTKVILEFTV